MRLSAPHLALTLTTAALCTLAGTPSAYAGDAATAEVTPKHVAPGEQVTISVTCPATGGSPPQHMDAHSQAFEHGTVRLQRVQHHQNNQHHQNSQNSQNSHNNQRTPQDQHSENNPQYDESNENGQYDDGSEGLDPTGELDPSDGLDPAEGLDPSEGSEGADGLAGLDGLDPSGSTGLPGPAAAGGGIAYHGTARVAAAASFEGGGPNAVGANSEWAVDGTCHGDGQWKATVTVTRTAHTSTHQPTHHPTHTAPAAARGVQAGREGGFSDSPAALAAGALLVAGALGAAVHRLRRDRASAR
ncbi:hypothetical protein GCM10010252_41890 [Streptomyces aureoverticillatus]|nr:hypothetical protein GCM10010252_41890 [Streptomyces aureoverticillatus]